MKPLSGLSSGLAAKASGCARSLASGFAEGAGAGGAPAAPRESLATITSEQERSHARSSLNVASNDANLGFAARPISSSGADDSSDCNQRTWIFQSSRQFMHEFSL